MNITQHKFPLCWVKKPRLLALKNNILDDTIHTFQKMQTGVTESQLPEDGEAGKGNRQKSEVQGN